MAKRKMRSVRTRTHSHTLAHTRAHTHARTHRSRSTRCSRGRCRPSQRAASSIGICCTDQPINSPSRRAPPRSLAAALPPSLPPSLPSLPPSLPALPALPASARSAQRTASRRYERNMRSVRAILSASATAHAADRAALVLPRAPPQGVAWAVDGLITRSTSVRSVRREKVRAPARARACALVRGCVRACVRGWARTWDAWALISRRMGWGHRPCARE